MAWLGRVFPGSTALRAGVRRPGPFLKSSDEVWETKADRQAEVVVPGELSLEGVARVVVRSEADRLTPMTLIGYSPTNRSIRGRLDRIVVFHRLFCGHWPYVERVDRFGDVVRIAFSPGRHEWATYAARLVWRDGANFVVTEEAIGEIGIKNPWRVPIPAGNRDARIRVSLFLDDAPAFTGWFDPGAETFIPPAP